MPRRKYHCPHGLDLRLHGRCYICEPIEVPTYAPPVGCTCPTYWWGVVPPPCPVHNPSRPYYPTVTTSGTSVAPYCGICGTFHIPGGGPCTATYS